MERYNIFTYDEYLMQTIEDIIEVKRPRGIPGQEYIE